MQIIAETGADMKAFENSGKLTGWTGLRPRNDESAGKYKSTAVTHGNKIHAPDHGTVCMGSIKDKRIILQKQV